MIHTTLLTRKILSHFSVGNMSSIVNDLTDAVIAPHLHSRFHHSIGMIAQNHLLMQKELHSFSPSTGLVAAHT